MLETGSESCGGYPQISSHCRLTFQGMHQQLRLALTAQGVASESLVFEVAGVPASLGLCVPAPALFPIPALQKWAEVYASERVKSKGTKTSNKGEEMKIIVPQSTESSILLPIVPIRPSVPVLQKC